MNVSSIYEPGEKNHTDENFPVASYLISKKHRKAILAFYTFARAADDVADHPELAEDEKIRRLDLFEATLIGASDTVVAALPLREAIAKRNLLARHALDLLIAFRQDARQSRYASWDDLMRYCSYSAAPVGRFVLDVHGESASLWPESDALCSALQIINHLQDCKADYLRLNRIYIPQDYLARYGVDENVISAPKSSLALRQCLAELAAKTRQSIKNTRFVAHIRDVRLSMEIATIEKLADRLLQMLCTCDPLSEKVHLNKTHLIFIVLHSVLETLWRKALNRKLFVSGSENI